ncbi:MAG: bifunctional serine/threonine-protein kinase/formylglycine-generating enzyme family protein [Polyangiaceae bacterium]
MSSLALVPGSVVGREFVIERVLGAGGMGAVYVAHQQSTGIRRALKVMNPDLLRDPSLHARFLQEARIGGSIPSDHVVQVITAGIDEATQVPFLVMDLLEGEELARSVEQRGRMDPTTLRIVFEQLCHGVGAAHRLGIVHRDLKPENIFLAAARSIGVPFVVKVLDFGIAKVVAEAKTKATAPMGTPLWMAPEQTARGAVITPAADVWALGLIAYYCLVGRCYWNAAGDENSSVEVVLREMLIEQLVPARERATEHGVALPPWFDAWFSGCLQRAPAERFPNANAVWDALRGHLGLDHAGAKPTAPGIAPELAATAFAPSLPATQGWSPEPGLLPGALATQLATTPIQTASVTMVGEPAVIPPSPRRSSVAGSKSIGPGWLVGVSLAIAGAAGIAFLGGRHGASPAPDSSIAVPSATEDIPRAPSSQPEGHPGVPVDEALVQFIRIPGGTFSPCPGDVCGAAVTLPSFSLARTEISQNEFARYVKETGQEPKGPCWVRKRADGAPSPKGDWHFPQAGGDYPVVCITRGEAEAFAEWLSTVLGKRVRLPTSVEWEYAAREGARSLNYAWGNDWPPPQGAANIADQAAAILAYEPKETKPVTEFNDGWTYAAPVGSTKPNGFGLFDMTGNAYEWVSDDCAVRGGSWDNAQGGLKTTHRMKVDCNARFCAAGFRVLREEAR